MNTVIKVIEFRLLNGSRPLRAFVDLQVGDWIIREWRVIKENGRRPRVAPPQMSWKGQDEQIQYKTIVTLPSETKGEIDLVILKRFAEEMERTSMEVDKRDLNQCSQACAFLRSQYFKACNFFLDIDNYLC